MLPYDRSDADAPHSRRINIYFNITSPTPGTFIIALHFKGREKPILEMDLKIDDLLEKVSLQGFVLWRPHVDRPCSKKIIKLRWIWSMSN